MKVYEIKRKEGAKNVFGISLVKTPAMESDYVFLKKQEEVVKLSKEEKIKLSKESDIKLSVIDNKKHLLLGLVLEPDKDIYRYNSDTNEEYFLRATAETISDLAYDYIKQSNQNYSTLEHDGKELDGVSFVEHWIVEDSKIDKSALHGLEFKKGSWATVAEVTNKTLWNEYIATGEVLGFSIDAMVHLEEVNLNKQEKMSEQKNELLQYAKDAIDTIRDTLGLSKKEEPKVEEVELKDEVGGIPKKYEDMTDEEKKEFDAKKKKEDIGLSEERYDIEDFKKVLDALNINFASAVKDALKPIQETNVSLSEQVKTLQEKVIELGEQPASKPIKTAPTNVDFSKMTDMQKYKYHRDNG